MELMWPKLHCFFLISDQYRAPVPAENNKLFMLVTFASAATEIDKSLFLHLMTQPGMLGSELRTGSSGDTQAAVAAGNRCNFPPFLSRVPVSAHLVVRV